jgi:DNA-directed RNA polymerase specialized sigma24 family protein
LPSSVRRHAWGPGGADIAAVDLRDTLVRLVRHLPPRQRAVVVRYWGQCAELEAAQLLGCTEGTVKSAAARGLRRLLELGGPEPGSAPTSKMT